MQRCYRFEELSGSGLRFDWHARLGGLEEAVTGAGSDVIFLQVLAYEFYGDRAPAVVGVRLGVVADGVKMGEVIADGGECLFLVLPAFGEVGLPAGGLAHTLEDC